MASNLKDITDVLNRLQKLSKTTFEGMTSKQIKSAREELRKLEAELKGVKTTANDIGEEFEELKDGLGHLGKMATSPASGMRSAAKGASAWADRIKQTNSLASEFGVKLGIAGKVAGKLGVAVGGISKVLLGWPGLIIMGVKALVDSAVKIDSYIKNMNKSFAMVRGPEIMTKDVDKQFKDFNKSVVSLADNIRDGLRPAEVQEFMQSVSQAGLRIGKLNDGFFAYRDSVHVAAKASKVLGVEMARTGDMMVDMMTNLRMNLDEVDQAFVAVAFNAEKSGLSTERFWSAVKNASASLAFYGKFLKDVSNTTKVLTQSQITGADEAAGSAERISQAFNKSATQTNMAIIAIAKKGGANFKKLFKNVQAQAEAEVKGIEQELVLREAKTEKTSEDVKAIDDLKIKLINAQRNSDRLAIAAHNGDVAMAQELAMATGKSPSILMDVIKGIKGINFSTQETGEALEAIERGVEGVSKNAINKDDVRWFIENAHQGASLVKMTAKELKYNKAQTGAQKSFVKSLNTLNENTPSDSINLMSKTMSELYDVSEEQAKKMLWAATTNEKTLKATQGVLSIGYDSKVNGEEALKLYEKIVDNQDAGATITKKQMSEDAASSAETKKAYDDTFEKIRDNTLSIEDMKDITSSAVKYQAASLFRLDKISVGVSRIVGKMFGEKPGADQREALKSLPEDIKGEIKKGGIGLPLGKAVMQKQEALATINTLTELKKQNKVLSKGQQQQWDNAQKQLKDSSEMITKLEAVDVSTVQMTTLMEADIKSDPAKRAALYDIAKSKLAGMGKSTAAIGDFAKVVGKDLVSVMREEARSRPGETTQRTVPLHRDETGKASYTEEFVQLKQGLQNPETVTHAGAVVLHPKETILPASYNGFQTKPMMMGGTASTTPSGAGAGKTIQINVTATEKDLAQRIANEVRSVLYKEQVNNLG
jgi:hypothetical protein